MKIKTVITISKNDYEEVLGDLAYAKEVLLTTRESWKRNQVDFLIDRAVDRLTREDDIESRVSSLETSICY